MDSYVFPAVKELVRNGETDKLRNILTNVLLSTIRTNTSTQNVQLLLDAGVTIESLDRTLYKIIFQYGRLDVLKVLLANCTQSHVESFQPEAILNTFCDVKPSPLHWAVWYRKFEMIHFLVDKGFNVNDKCIRRYITNPWLINNANLSLTMFSPLHYAAEINDWELTTLLIKLGADIFDFPDANFPGRETWTPFTIAVEQGHTDLALKKLLPDDINVCDSSGIKKVLSAGNGLELNVCGTMLHYACSTNSLKSVKLLIEHGADVNKIADGYLPVQIAILVGEYKIMEYIFPLTDLQPEHWTKEQLDMAYESYIYHISFEPSSVYVPKLGDKELGKYILDIGNPEVDIRHFILVCGSGRSDRVKALLESGQIPDTYDDDGFCHPLWSAVDLRNGEPSYECVKAVLEYNPDMTLTNKKVPAGTGIWDSMNGAKTYEAKSGTTVMQEALLMSDTEIITLLVEAGCCLLNTGAELEFVRDDIEPRLKPHILETLEKYCDTPRGLQHLAKFGVRRCLGHKNVDKKIDALPIPKYIKDYLKDVGL